MTNNLHTLNHEFITTRIKELNYNLHNFKRRFASCYRKVTTNDFTYASWAEEIYHGVQRRMYESNLEVLALTLKCNVSDLIVGNSLLAIEPTENKPITKLNIQVIQDQLKYYKVSKSEFFYLFVHAYQKEFDMSPIAELIDRLYDGKQKTLYTKTLPVLANILQLTVKDITYVEPTVQDSLVQDVKQLQFQFEQFIKKYNV